MKHFSHNTNVTTSSVPLRLSMLSVPSQLLRKVGITEKDFVSLINIARNNTDYYPAKIIAKLGFSSQQDLPPNYQDWLVTKPVTIYPKGEFEFRVKGERSLTRLRIEDFPNELTDRLNELTNIKESVFCTNLMVCYYLWGWDYIYWWNRLGALESVDDWKDKTKHVTALLKAVNMPDSYLPLVECTGMLGYRLLPDPSFNLKDATRESATGLGIVHEFSEGLSESVSWLGSAAMLVRSAKSNYYHDFSHFINDYNRWSTSGSSSLGRLQFSYIHEGNIVTKKIKAKKNMLQYLTTPSELELLSQKTTISTNIAVVKSELAKIRIAVAGDLGFYLIWSYITNLTGSDYEQWTGVTLNETPSDELTRIISMRSSLSLAYGFPADFEKFDSQPTTEEIHAIGAALIRTASQTQDLPGWLIDNCLSGLSNSTLSCIDNGDQFTFKVRDYLPSGIAITSAVGNAFNCVATETCVRVVEAWTAMNRPVWLKNLALRGDDSSYITTSAAAAALLSIAAEGLGYKFARSKIAIIPGCTELLRVFYNSESARGYPSRLIPTLTQRKPWSNTPWDGEGSIAAQISTLSALERRRVDTSNLREFLLASWERKRSLPRTVLHIPKYNGGLGLLSPQPGIVTPPLDTLPQLRGVNVVTNEWADSLVINKARRLNIPLQPGVARRLSQDVAVKTLSTVDVADLFPMYQSRYKENVRLPRFIRSTDPVEANLSMFVRTQIETIVASLSITPPTTNILETIITSSSWKFGRYKSVSESVLFVKEVSRYQDVSLDPYFELDVQLVMRSTRLTRAVAEEWLIGMPPTTYTGNLHPQLNKYIVGRTLEFMALISGTTDIIRIGFINLWLYASSRFSLALFDSDFHKANYSW